MVEYTYGITFRPLKGRFGRPFTIVLRYDLDGIISFGDAWERVTALNRFIKYDQAGFIQAVKEIGNNTYA